METTFRTVTIVTIVMVLVEVLLNFDVFEFKLEEKLFGKFEEVGWELRPITKLAKSNH